MFSNRSNLTSSTIILILTVVVGGCSSTRTAETNDPHESINRKMYAFNDSLDKTLVEPVAKSYVKATPEPIRDAITNFFDNVTYLNTIANDLLQGKIKQFFHDSGRFVVNSSLGVGGLFDPAAKLGLSKNEEDLGQTFGVWGAEQGAYLTLPLLGPSSYRDVGAPVMGMLLNPITYFAMPVTIPAGLVNAVNSRANLLDATRIRDQAALDPYTFVREAWRQQREYQIYDGNPPGDDFEDYIEGEGDAAILRVY